MWKFAHIDTLIVGATLVCSLLTQHLFTRQSELWSEALSWIILPTLSRIWGSGSVASKDVENQPASGVSLWVAALAVATVSLYQTENGLIPFFPALVPLLLVVDKYFGYGVPGSVWGSSLVAVGLIITLSSSFQRTALSSIPVIALFVVYVVLTRSGTNAPSCRVDVESAIRPLSLRVIPILLVILGVESVAFGPRTNVVHTVSLGLAKALTWYFLLRTAQSSSWCTAAAIVTFSIISTRDPFTLTSGVQTTSHLVAAFFALGQVISLTPKATARSVLWIFILVYLVPYLVNIQAIHIAQSSVISPHPIEVLIQKARSDFKALVDRQSANYTAAHEEYRRRYGVEPPPGFEAWYNFAKAHQSPMIDEFDVIYNSISPFWRIPGSDINQAINRAQNLPNSDLWLCRLSGKEAKVHCSHPHRSFDRNIQVFFNTVLADLRGLLPDITFLVNHLDEPRVLLPPSEAFEPLNMTDYSKQRVWERLTRSCPQSRKNDSQTVETYGLPFVTDRVSGMDLCNHPEYRESHGLAISPMSFPLIEGSVPILSTGSPSTMGDILYPSPAYLEPEFQYTETNDVDWAQKRNNLYWAGSTTGGFATNDWQHFHRQRFVKLAQNLGGSLHAYLREESGATKRVESPFLNRRLFDVSFTRIFQCGQKTCHEQRTYFDVKPWADKDQALRSKLAFDLDGNGISGRYYKLLASRSVPLKHTLLREWHDDRLVPWVHYIPVSQSMDELPELVMYLTSESGQKQAREIAEQGRDWFSKAFRREDLAVYMYRLFLELARLQDSERKAS